MEIFQLRTPTVTQRRSVRPDGSTCFLFFYHVLDIIFAGEQIVLDIIDVVFEKLLQAENRAAKEVQTCLKSFPVFEEGQIPSGLRIIIPNCQPLIVHQKQRGQGLRGNLLIQAFYSLLLFGSTPIGHPRSTKTGTSCLLIIG